MKPPYCMPIIVPTLTKAESTMNAFDSDYQFFEIWLDYLEAIDDAALLKLAKKYDKRLVVVFRRKDLTPIRLSVTRRKQIIDALAGTNVLVDLDITSQLEELTYAEGKVRILASYHDYQATPADVELREITCAMAVHQPYIYKLATKCQSPADAVRLLQLQMQLKQDGKRMIVLGMGEHGYVTRIFGTLWGNELSFAPHNKASQTAPGQLTKQQLEVIFKELHNAGK